ncbi:hypothetical protein TWF506_009660 [Arthrobotrys conoides]|uniref:Uncharacterized protein n=1 Tax=Arthrobotrys conoides TaxID=74498 RepID=A0AAN8NFV0_9PEZI
MNADEPKVVKGKWCRKSDKEAGSEVHRNNEFKEEEYASVCKTCGSSSDKGPSQY